MPASLGMNPESSRWLDLYFNLVSSWMSLRCTVLWNWLSVVTLGQGVHVTCPAVEVEDLRRARKWLSPSPCASALELVVLNDLLG